MARSTPRSPMRYEREQLEFERLAFFSDAIYAISLTLLVVGLELPTLADPGSVRELWDRLVDLQGEIVMFFISFIVIGSFWLAHHRFFARLAAADRHLLSANLVYLAFIAFLPFPSGILGEYAQNPLSVALYALCLAIVAGLEVVLLWLARRGGLLAVPMSDLTFRWAVIASTTPVAVFLISIPLAFVSASLAIASWLTLVVIGPLIGRRMPQEAAEYFNN